MYSLPDLCLRKCAICMYTYINTYFSYLQIISFCEYVQKERRKRHLNAASSVPSPHNNITHIADYILIIIEPHVGTICEIVMRFFDTPYDLIFY